MLHSQSLNTFIISVIQIYPEINFSPFCCPFGVELLSSLSRIVTFLTRNTIPKKRIQCLGRLCPEIATLKQSLQMYFSKFHMYLVSCFLRLKDPSVNPQTLSPHWQYSNVLFMVKRREMSLYSRLVVYCDLKASQNVIVHYSPHSIFHGFCLHPVSPNHSSFQTLP